MVQKFHLPLKQGGTQPVNRIPRTRSMQDGCKKNVKETVFCIWPRWHLRFRMRAARLVSAEVVFLCVYAMPNRGYTCFKISWVGPVFNVEMAIILKCQNNVCRCWVFPHNLQVLSISVLNVAAGKAPMQSSVADGGIPQKAIDGSTSTFFDSDTCSLTEVSSY